MIQRFFDIVLSSIAIVLLAPILLAIMAVLRFTGEGEVFYRQQRVGKNGHIFGLLKFATMIKNSPNLGTGLITTQNDPRVLPVGKLLRKTKLNELPQIFNIFIGDMSIVGPRPQVPKHFEIYNAEVQHNLKELKPGLTGIGSIFFRDEEIILERNKHLSYDICYRQIIAPYKGQLEMWFKEHNSVRLYFLLIFLTAWVVVFPKSRLHLKTLKSLPPPPNELAEGGFNRV